MIKKQIVNNQISCEILAPAGSFQAMKAAFSAGADAVYAGGMRFGARASAANFGQKELLEAIDYAHIRGKKVYLTVNTLLKEKELYDSLYEYLLPFYEAGLDAVIVQDYGVLSFVREHFPELPVHASTQMNTTGPYFAEELKRLGVSRVVTARELSLQEIRTIYQKTGLEIESFVHGALCYCYSGQCLLSSMIGSRSGNRGRCAQPCRLAYDVVEDGRILNTNAKKYAISPKDLCTLQILPDILEAGVYSLKIEGRMKKPEYVAGVTAIYRKYVDLYLKKGRDGYKVSGEDIRMLKELYNRGGFTEGYYKKHNGKDMMALEKPNHCGVLTGEITRLSASTITVKLTENLQKGDVLQFPLKAQSADYTIGEPKQKGEQLSIRNRFQNGLVISEKQLLSREVVRIRNNQLIDEITAKYVESEPKLPVTGTAAFRLGEPAVLELEYGGFVVRTYGQVVEPAQKRPVTEADIRKQLGKTGGTEYEFAKLEIFCEENIFVPLKELNELRRAAFESLTEKVTESFRREADGKQIRTDQTEEFLEPDKTAAYSALISKAEQWEAVREFAFIRQIYLETALFSMKQLEQIACEADRKGILVYFALPYIFRENAYDNLKETLSQWETLPVEGFVVRNTEEYFFIRTLLKEQKKFIFDNTIYCYNTRAAEYLETLQPEGVTYSNELNVQELSKLQILNGELEIYGYFPAMISAGCIKKNYGKCDGQTAIGRFALKDRTKSILPVMNVCAGCYNLIYHAQPKCLFEEQEEIRQLKPKTLRFSFAFESRAETEDVLNCFAEGRMPEGNTFTKGHFKRGVQ